MLLTYLAVTVTTAMTIAVKTGQDFIIFDLPRGHSDSLSHSNTPWECCLVVAGGLVSLYDPESYADGRKFPW